MADRWEEVADERQVVVTRTQLWRWDGTRTILSLLLAALTLAGAVGAAWDDDLDFSTWFAGAALFGIPLALLLTWRIRFEVRPREVVRSAGPLAFLTRTRVPLSSFESVVCDYDRRLDNYYAAPDDEDPEGIEVRYSYRVSLVGPSLSWRIGAFQNRGDAERLARALASRFALSLVGLLAHPSLEQVRESERIDSDVLIREAD